MMGYPLFPFRLRTLRKGQDLTLMDVAKGIGVSEATISRWEGGSRSPNSAQVEALAKFFKVRSIDFLGQVGESLIVSGEVRVGLWTTLGHYVVLEASGGKQITIGQGCAIGNAVVIITAHDGMDESVEIGDGCVVGAGAIILPGVKLEPGSKVWPGRVVSKDAKSEVSPDI